MPHSSGGGSHGGGSHHSSHHSSGGRGGGSSGPRVSTTRYPGSRRYCYYDKRRGMQYFYCSADPAKAFKPKWFMVFFYLPFLLVMGSMFADVFHIPTKVTNSDSYILIEDHVGAVENANALSSSLSAFYEETGVTPAVITVFHEEWKGKYSSLEKYAYDLYVHKFADEKHWLVVYSVPESVSGSFVDWHWEGMLGDDTGGMITHSIERSFTDKMQKNLLLADNGKIDNAVSKTFADTISLTHNATIDWELLGPMAIMLLFICGHAALMLFATNKNVKYRKAVPAPEPQDLPITCDYCGSTFTLDTKTNCPNCGAALNIPQPSQGVPQTSRF